MVNKVVIPYSKVRPATESVYHHNHLFRDGQLYSKVCNAFHRDRTTTRIGSLMPNWEEVIADGQDASTSFQDELWETTVFTEPYLYINYIGYRDQEQYYYGTNIGWDEAVLEAGSNIGPSLIGLAENRGLVKAWEKLGSHFEGMTALGELRETVRGIRNPAMALRKGFDDYLYAASRARKKIRRANLPRRAKRKAYVEAVSGTWLEYSFGWKPFLNDIEDGFVAFRERLGAPAIQKFRAAGVADGRKQVKTMRGIWYSQNAIYNNAHFKCVVIYTGGAKSLLTSDASVLDSLGIYPAAFVPTAWELAPWSFAIDYFTNVGGVLNAWALATRVGVQYVNMTVVSSVENLIVYVPGYVPAQLPWIREYKFTNGVSRVLHKTVSRVANMPGLNIPSFTTDMKLSWGKDLNLAALTAQMTKDWGRP